MAKIGIDIDGVLADFVGAYNDLILTQTGIALPASSDTYPDVWEYDKAAGLTHTQLSELWKHIGTTSFWVTLHALPGAVDALQRLWEVRRDEDIYFITSRPGLRAKQQTERWLSWHGFPEATVLISNGAAQKALVAQALELDAFIEDNATNLAKVMEARPTLKGYLLDKPYNRGKEERELAGKPFHRMTSLEAILQALAQRYTEATA